LAKEKKKIELLPWSFQFELVEGCNRACAFCGIHAIRDMKKGEGSLYKYMELDVHRKLVSEIAEWRPKARVEYNNHGEPTLHPHFFDMIRTHRELAPQNSIQVQTNCHVMFGKDLDIQHAFEFIKKSFTVGVNLFVANGYNRKFYKTLLQMNEAGIFDSIPGLTVVDFYNDNPKNLSPYHNYGPKKKILFIMDDLAYVQDKSPKASRLILNEAGSTPKSYMEKVMGQEPFVGPLAKPCTRVFREMTFAWNGIVPICCYDWKNAFILGNAAEEYIKDIWFGSTWMTIRGLLSRKTKWRGFSPCDLCNYNGGFRVGLLPEVPEVVPDADTMLKLIEHMQEYAEYQYPSKMYHIGGILYRLGKHYDFKG